MIRATNLFFSISTAASSVGAVQYALNSAQLTANQPFNDAFVSYSIEFSSFPDFAGNDSNPNTFSDTLLNNIGNLTGTKPYIRVGGNTQDFALYNASLTYALNGTFNYSRSYDYPSIIYIGPSYFESYAQWPNVKFSHGFNLGLGAISAEGWQTLLDTVPLACEALGGGKLYQWEYGNEPDLYASSSTRPASWNETTYVEQWLNGTRQIRASLEESCPDMLDNSSYGYLAPSFGGVGNKLKAPTTWEAGLDDDGDVNLFSTHNYISGANSPGVTLQGTLLNHTQTMSSIDAHVSEYQEIWPDGTSSGVPMVFGEHNSLYNQGKPGLSNSFGAALWGVDFNLYAASVGVRRVHMHMGTDYRYASWQPIQTENTTIGTKPPYYGNIAVAAFLGNTLTDPVQIAHVPLSDDDAEAAYAAYSVVDEDDAANTTQQLLRTIVINMHGYNTTLNGTGLGVAPNTTARVARVYTFDVSSSAPSLGAGDQVLVQRLSANGSDAITGITWDAWSYNWELDEGRPVRLANATVDGAGGQEYVTVGEDGTVAVSVPDSSVAMLSFVGGGGGSETGNNTGASSEATTLGGDGVIGRSKREGGRERRSRLHR